MDSLSQTIKRQIAWKHILIIESEGLSLEAVIYIWHLSGMALGGAGGLCCPGSLPFSEAFISQYRLGAIESTLSPCFVETSRVSTVSVPV